MFKQANLDRYTPQQVFLLTGTSHGLHRYYLCENGLYSSPEEAFESGATEVTHLLYGVTFERGDLETEAGKAMQTCVFQVTLFACFLDLLGTLRESAKYFPLT